MNAMAKNVYEALALTDVTDAAKFYGINVRTALLTPRANAAPELATCPALGLRALHDLMLAAAETITAQAWASLPASEWRMPLPAPVPAEVTWQMRDGSALCGLTFVARRRFGALVIDLADDETADAALRLAA